MCLRGMSRQAFGERRMGRRRGGCDGGSISQQRLRFEQVGIHQVLGEIMARRTDELPSLVTSSEAAPQSAAANRGSHRQQFRSLTLRDVERPLERSVRLACPRSRICNEQQLSAETVQFRFIEPFACAIDDAERLVNRLQPCLGLRAPQMRFREQPQVTRDELRGSRGERSRSHPAESAAVLLRADLPPRPPTPR